MSPRQRRRILLFGSGGHARVCLDALFDDEATDVVGAVSDDVRTADGLGVAWLGHPDDLQNITQSVDTTTFCVAIGRNITRQERTRNLTQSGWYVTHAISRHAVVSRSAELGMGVQLLPGAIVNAGARLGDGVIVNTRASIDHDCVIGAYAHVAPGVALAGDVDVGERALVGIGACAVPGVRIGADAVVGAGAVVVDDVPDGVTVVGVPARPLVGKGRT